MKKLLLVFSVVAGLLFVNMAVTQAQDSLNAESTEAVEETAPPVEETTPPPAIEEEPEEELQGHQLLMQRFIEGGAGFMGIVLVCLILGLAFAIERIITLSLASTNVKKLLSAVEDNLSKGNVEGAKELCKSSRSPVASIMYQGLDRVKEGIEVVEKSVVAYGSVQMGLLEKGLIWISLFIALAPMLGFMGTVIGMIDAFDAIEAAGDISPSVVAGGIKVALLTTVFGLIVAIILQVFYNYIVSRVDGIVNEMEDASISFVDMLIKHKITDK